MIEAITYADMLEHIRNNDLVEDTVGILLTRPDLQTGEEIMGSLNYYHHLTGYNINFYLPGYGAYWNDAEYPDMRFAADINGVSWSFSDKAFVSFVNTIENVSRWKYSGESELLLIPYHDKNLDYSNVAVFRLDAMLKDDAISSISNFITCLSRNAKHNNSVNSLALKGATKSVAKTLAQGLIDKALKDFPNPIRKGKHYICKNFSR